MKVRWVVMAALAGAALLPTVASAQVYENIVVRRAGSGMLGVATEAVGGSVQQPARQRVVVDVVAGSAAQRAGLAVGDTILRINGLAATEQVMFAPLEEGDTVVLRVRRGGAERDVRVVAGARPQQQRDVFTYTLPDSVQRQMSVIIRGVQDNLDTIARRGMRFERTPGDSAFMFRFGNDSVRVFSMPRGEMMSDSLRAMFRDMTMEMSRFLNDSVAFRFRTGPDSAAIRIFGPPGSGAWVQMDTIRFLNPAEAMTGSVMMGMRAVAGAELSELNPGLAEYFGVMSGVLVLNAREGTPAANAGIRAGDVIVRANGVTITSVADLRRVIGQAGPRAPVEIRLLRHGQPVDVRLGG
jgi:membrane-associated protease RseP (regulator of RpoE activity)